MKLDAWDAGAPELAWPLAARFRFLRRDEVSLLWNGSEGSQEDKDDCDCCRTRLDRRGLWSVEGTSGGRIGMTTSMEGLVGDLIVD